MSIEKLGDTAREAAGRLDKGEARVAEAAEKLKGEARNFANKLDEPIERAKQALEAAADRAVQAIARAADQAVEAYGSARETMQDVRGQVDPFVKTRPYAALAIAGACGLVIGAMVLGRGPKVVYLKPRQD